MKKKVSLELLDKTLSRAAKLLDGCADQMRELQLNPQRNIERIGQALATIFEIQQEIYKQHPDLMPDYLKKDSEKKRKRRS